MLTAVSRARRARMHARWRKPFVYSAGGMCTDAPRCVRQPETKTFLLTLFLSVTANARHLRASLSLGRDVAVTAVNAHLHHRHRAEPARARIRPLAVVRCSLLSLITGSPTFAFNCTLSFRSLVKSSRCWRRARGTPLGWSTVERFLSVYSRYELVYYCPKRGHASNLAAAERPARRKERGTVDARRMQKWSDAAGASRQSTATRGRRHHSHVVSACILQIDKIALRS